MTLEPDTKEVVGFTLVPIGTGVNIGDGGEFGFGAGDTGPDDNPAQPAVITVVVVDDFHLVFLEPVNPGNGLNKKTGLIKNFRSRDHLLRVAEHIKMNSMLVVFADRYAILTRSLFDRFFFGGSGSRPGFRCRGFSTFFGWRRCRRLGFPGFLFGSHFLFRLGRCRCFGCFGFLLGSGFGVSSSQVREKLKQRNSGLFNDTHLSAPFNSVVCAASGACR